MKLHKVTNTTKSNISEAYKLQADFWEDLESNSYEKNNMKEKANDLVRLHKEMQEKLKTDSIIFRTNPSSYLVLKKYCSEYFNACEYLA